MKTSTKSPKKHTQHQFPHKTPTSHNFQLTSLACEQQKCEKQVSLRCPLCEHGILIPCTASSTLLCSRCYFFQKKTYCFHGHLISFHYIANNYSKIKIDPKNKSLNFIGLLSAFILSSFCIIYLIVNMIKRFY